MFRAVTTAALLQLGVTPSAPVAQPVEKQGAKKPVVVAATAKPETEALDDGFDDGAVDADDDDDPPAGTAGLTEVPDVKGCSARGSLRVLHEHSLEMELDGSGRVVSQRPEPGRQVRIGTHIRVSLGNS